MSPYNRHEVMAFAFSPDSRYVTSGTRQGVIGGYDTKTGNFSFGPLTGQTGAIECISYLPDGKHMLSASSTGHVKVLKI